MPIRFAANLSTLFTELPFLERFDAATECGFKQVEFQIPYDFSAADIAARVSANQLEVVLFNLPAGDWDNGEKGIAALKGRETEFADGVAKGIEYAKTLNCPQLHCMAGIPDSIDESTRDRYLDRLGYAAQECAKADKQLLIEPINNIDIPGYYLSDFQQAVDIIETLRDNSDIDIGLQFDIYHCAKIYGVKDRTVENWIINTAPHIHHFQIAGIPHRHEPNIGNLPLQSILNCVNTHKPDLIIGCEYFPEKDAKDGLGWITESNSG